MPTVDNKSILINSADDNQQSSTYINILLSEVLSEHSHTYSIIPVSDCSCSNSSDKKLRLYVY